MRLLPLFVFGIGIATTPAFGQLVGPINFETSGLGNFFANSGGTFASEQIDAGNGFLAVDATGATSVPYIGVYKPSADPVPGFSGAFTIGLDISSPLNNASFGIYLFDTTNQANNLLAIYNLNYPTGGNVDEQIRFWRDSSITNGTVANQYVAGSISGTNGAFDGNSWITNASSRGATTSTTSPFTYYHLDFAYDPDARTLRLSSAAFSATLSIPVADVINNPGFAIRINDPSLTVGAPPVKVDNITVVPEPGSAAMLALAGLAVGLRRRR
jgi:hypothetical protein